MRKILLLILTFTIGISQIQYGGEPKYKLDWKEINFLNTYNLKKINNNLHPMVLKYGDEYGLDINILNQSTKIISKNETTFYLGFESKNAKAISLVFDEFKLSQNSKMFIYNHDNSMFIGSFNSKNVFFGVNINNVLFTFGEGLKLMGSISMIFSTFIFQLARIDNLP